VYDAAGHPVGQVGLGNRKDIRNAVEAAHQAKAWGAATGHNRAQVLYYVAENFAARAAEFEARLIALTGVTAQAAQDEVELSIRRMFYYAAQADKFDGAVHATRTRNVTLAMNEPWGVMAIVCPNEAPLTALVSLLMPALGMGNRVICVPSARYALIATDLYQVFDTSDVPGGVANIVTGDRDELAKVLAQHDDVAAMWYVGSKAGSAMVERESAGNLKYTWVNHGMARDWHCAEQGQGPDYLRRATQVKNIWVPYGE
jgi:aldehyde dehydrogenase (NAD+)